MGLPWQVHSYVAPGNQNIQPGYHNNSIDILNPSQILHNNESGSHVIGINVGDQIYQEEAPPSYESIFGK